jgi:PhnB protein
MQASPHLHFKGNCREAFNFYAATLRGRIAFAMTYGESPAASQTPPEVRDQIIHARLEFGDQALMGCDPPRERFQPAQGFNVLLTVQEPAEAERVFVALAREGSISMPFAQTFWAYRFGMCTDRFGIPWMVNCERAP